MSRSTHYRSADHVGVNEKASTIQMVVPYKWKVHTCEVSEEQIITVHDHIKVCQHVEVLVKGGMKKNVMKHIK